MSRSDIPILVHFTYKEFYLQPCLTECKILCFKNLNSHVMVMGPGVRPRGLVSLKDPKKVVSCLGISMTPKRIISVDEVEPPGVLNENGSSVSPCVS